jgi:hypothetical protein
VDISALLHGDGVFQDLMTELGDGDCNSDRKMAWSPPGEYMCSSYAPHLDHALPVSVLRPADWQAPSVHATKVDLCVYTSTASKPPGINLYLPQHQLEPFNVVRERDVPWGQQSRGSSSRVKLREGLRFCPNRSQLCARSRVWPPKWVLT